jgi:hypothetical protein
MPTTLPVMPISLTDFVEIVILCAFLYLAFVTVTTILGGK